MIFWNGVNTETFKLGSGKMLVTLRGPEILGIQGPPYTSPVFCSLVPMESYFVSTEPGGPGMARHRFSDLQNRLFDSDQQAPGEAIDWLPPEHCLMIRSFLTAMPLSFRLEPGAGASLLYEPAVTVRTRRFPCITIHLAAGAPLDEGYVLPEERFLRILLLGHADYDEVNRTVYIRRGHSSLLIAGGETPLAMMHDLSWGITLPPPVWEEPVYEKVSVLPVCVRRSVTGTLSRLIARQDMCGGLVGEIRPEASFFAQLPENAMAAVALEMAGFHDRAAAALHFLQRSWAKNRIFARTMGLGQCCYPDQQLPEGGLPAFAVLAAELVSREDASLRRILAPMVECAMRHMTDSLRGNMLGWNGREACFNDRMVLAHAVSGQGSALNTLLYLAAAKAAQNWLRPPLSTAVRQHAEAVRRTFASHFIPGGVWSMVSPTRRDGGSARIRYGICERCSLEGRWPLQPCWLERAPDGLYVCFSCRCLPGPKLIYDPAERHPCSGLALIACSLGLSFDSIPMIPNLSSEDLFMGGYDRSFWLGLRLLCAFDEDKRREALQDLADAAGRGYFWPPHSRRGVPGGVCGGMVDNALALIALFGTYGSTFGSFL